MLVNMYLYKLNAHITVESRHLFLRKQEGSGGRILDGVQQLRGLRNHRAHTAALKIPLQCHLRGGLPMHRGDVHYHLVVGTYISDSDSTYKLFVSCIHTEYCMLEYIIHTYMLSAITIVACFIVLHL